MPRNTSPVLPRKSDEQTVAQNRDKVIHFMPWKVELRQMIGAAPRTECGSERKAVVFAHAPPPPIPAHG